MAATASIKLSFPIWYRGGTRTMSNRYHFDTGTPSGSTAWTALMNAVLAAFKLVVPAGVNLMQVDGYAPGSEVPVFSANPTFAGTYAPTGQGPLPNDACGLIRWSTDVRTSKNHPVYLYQYMKPAYTSASGNGEQLLPSYQTALQTYANAWVAGFSDGTNTYHRAGPNGAVAQGAFIDQYIRHRDFRI